MDSATARGMTKFGFYGYFWNDEVSVLTATSGMTKFGLRSDARNHKAVMLREVAASMVE